MTPLVKALEAEGLQLWWDRDIEYGQNFHTVIEQALTAAMCVIVVWTRASVQSEWVLNEASDARKRGRLLPVILEPVTPPLEFRHLQTADLSDWNGEPTDPQFTGLLTGVDAMLGRRDTPTRAAHTLSPGRRWWQTWPAWAVGLGGALIGVSTLLFTLKHVGLIGGLTRETTIPSGQARAPAVSPSTPATVATEPLNLLDTEAGARLLYTNSYQERYWDMLFKSIPATAPGITTGGFAVLALRSDKDVTFDTLAIFVDGVYVSHGIKDLALFTSASPEGPFAKVAQITVPDHAVIRQPFLEFHFPPVQARYVKLQVLSSYSSGGSAYVGSIRLYASNTSSTF